MKPRTGDLRLLKQEKWKSSNQGSETVQSVLATSSAQRRTKVRSDATGESETSLAPVVHVQVYSAPRTKYDPWLLDSSFALKDTRSKC